MRLDLEHLPARDLPATLALSGGVLDAVLTGGNDSVTVSISGTTQKLSLSGGDVWTAVPAGWRGLNTATVSGPIGSVTAIQVHAGDGDDVVNLQSNTVPVSVWGEGGADTVNICGNAPANTTTLNAILAGVYVDAEDLRVSDFGATSGNGSVVFTSGSIAGLAPATITYSGVSALTVWGSNSSALAEGFTVSGTGATLTLYAGAGVAVVDVQATAHVVGISSGSAADTFTVNAAGLGAAISLDLGGGYNSLTLDGSGFSSPLTVDITAGSVAGLGAYTISHSATGGGYDLDILGGSGDDVFNVYDLPSSKYLTVYGQGGDDVFNAIGTFNGVFVQ